MLLTFVVFALYGVVAAASPLPPRAQRVAGRGRGALRQIRCQLAAMNSAGSVPA
jgi:hypothetical protein